MDPSGARQTTLFQVAACGSLSGKSSRKCPPRLSLRSMAARAMASDTISSGCRSSAVDQPGLYSRLPGTPTFSARFCSAFTASSALRISSSRRTMPTLSCISSCSSYWIWNGPLASTGRSNGASAQRTAASTCWPSSPALGPPASLAYLAAYSPARLPNTIRSHSELPPSRLAPLMPLAHSPAANSPGTFDIWVSPSTRTPPIT